MNRYRFTLLAVCLVLGFLGGSDLKLLFNNPEPANVSITTLEQGEAPREWLSVTGGYWNLEQAISTSGTVDLEAFLIPLRSSQSPAGDIRVVFESRNPEMLELLQTYYFAFDSLEEQKAYLEENRDKFFGQYELTGMLVGGLIESGNRDKLLSLARELQMPIQDDVILISEGKTPEKFRGYFFSIVAVLGLLKFVQILVQGKKQGSTPAPAE